MIPSVAHLVDQIRDIMRKIVTRGHWAITVTDDDSDESPSALNIYVPDEAGRVDMRERLDLGRPETESDDWETYKPVGTVVISVIEHARFERKVYPIE